MKPGRIDPAEVLGYLFLVFVVVVILFGTWLMIDQTQQPQPKPPNHTIQPQNILET